MQVICNLQNRARSQMDEVTQGARTMVANGRTMEHRQGYIVS